MKTIEGFVSIKNNSLVIKNGVIQFYYNSSIDTKMTINFFVKDLSTHSSIRFSLLFYYLIDVIFTL